MADPSQVVAQVAVNSRQVMKVVWMYQHPSNRHTFKKYNPEHNLILENAWQNYLNYEGPNHVEIHIRDDHGGTTPAVISFLQPMTQLSPRTEIRRAVKRFLEEEIVDE